MDSSTVGKAALDVMAQVDAGDGEVVAVLVAAVVRTPEGVYQASSRMEPPGSYAVVKAVHDAQAEQTGREELRLENPAREG